MSSDHPPRRSSTAPAYVPPAPPLPPDRYSLQARNAINRVFRFGAKVPEPQDGLQRSVHRIPSLSAYNASASHRTGLGISSLSINEQGTHALLAGREIFKTVRVEEGTCTEDANIRAAIRTYDASITKHTSASARPKDAVDIHDVAWAKGTSGDFVAAATYNGPIILYDLSRLGIEVARLFDHRRQIHRVTFNPHAGHLMLSASQDGTVRLWDIRDCQRNVSTFNSRFSIPGQTDGIRDVKWSPTNGTEFALGTDGGWIQKWDLAMPKAAKTRIAAHSQMISTIDWHPDGKHLLSASTDKSVKVWNLAAEGRRQKASYEIRTPYPLRNARWRPPCQSSMPLDNGARQCTQLVTSYEKDFPILHIWDLRRPMLPFRELECFNTSPTDLLWHSQDLLWTVGREGTFLQNDIKYTPKIMDNRSMQAFAVSPLGEVNHVTQRRLPYARSPPNKETSSSARGYNRGSFDKQVIDRMSRGSADDSLDETFLSASFRHQHKRSTSIKGTKSLSATPPSSEVTSDRNLALDEVLNKRKSFRPQQSAARGLLPGAPNVLLLTYFAQKYKSRPYPQPPSVEHLLKIAEVFNENAHHAELASMYRVAQSWRILGQLVPAELRRRALQQRRLRILNKTPLMQPSHCDSPIVERAKKIVAQNREQNSKPNTPVSRPLHNGESLQPAQLETSSNVPTPLARPTTGRKDGYQHDDNLLPDLEREVTLELPPAVMSTGADRRSGRADPSAADPADMPHADFGTSLQDMDHERLQSSDWRPKQKQPLNLEPVYGNAIDVPPKLMKHNSDESFGMFSSFSSSRVPSLPDSLASSKSQLMAIVREDLAREGSEGSSESPTLQRETSTMSGLEVNSIANLSSHPSFTSNMSLPTDEDKDTLAERPQLPVRAKTAAPAMERRDVLEDMQILARNNQESFSSESEAQLSLQQDDQIQESGNMEASGTIVPDEHRIVTRSRGVSTTKSADVSRTTKSAPAATTHSNQGTTSSSDGFIPSDFLPSHEAEDTEATNPFTLITLLKQLLNYHTTTLSDAQTASHLILLLAPLLPQTHPLSDLETDTTISLYTEHLSSLGHTDTSILTILDSSLSHLIAAGLQPLQAESILCTYHTQLRSLALHNEAAYLRRLCYPSFPTVYEQALRDVEVGTRCGGCRRPIVNARNKLWCDSCGKEQASCPVCGCRDSVFEAVGKGRKAKAGRGHESAGIGAQEGGTGGNGQETMVAAPRKANLFTTCLDCNHSAHTACLAQWQLSESTCPVAGCPCVCIGDGVGGPRATGGGPASDMGTAGAIGRRAAEQALLMGKRRKSSSMKSDEWAVGESRAVGSVRRGLSGAVNGGGREPGDRRREGVKRG